MEKPPWEVWGLLTGRLIWYMSLWGKYPRGDGVEHCKGEEDESSWSTAEQCQLLAASVSFKPHENPAGRMLYPQFTEEQAQAEKNHVMSHS